MYIRLFCAVTPKSSTPHSHRQTDLSCASSPASQTSLYSLSALQPATDKSPATSVQTPLSAVLANSQLLSVSSQPSSPSTSQRQLNSHCHRFASLSQPTSSESWFHLSASLQMSPPSETHISASPQGSSPSDTQSHLSKSSHMSLISDAQSHFSTSPQMSSPSDTQSHLSKSSQVSVPSDAQSHFSTSPQMSPPSDTQSHFSISTQMSSPSDTQSHLSKSSQVSQPSDTQSRFSTSPCRRSLASYQDDNILNDFIFPVENSMRIIQIPLVDIISKVVYVTTSRGSYVVKQPNCLEHNWISSCHFQIYSYLPILWMCCL